MKPYLVLCLGNEVVSDDGVGYAVARRLTAVSLPDDVEVIAASIAGFALLDLLAHRRAVLVVDAIVSGKAAPGTLYRFNADTLKPTRHLVGSHQINLSQALRLGCLLGMPMPERVDIVAVEAADVQTLSESLTPPVARAVPAIVAEVRHWIALQREEGLHAGAGAEADTVAAG